MSIALLHQQPSTVTRDQLREQIKQTVRDATQAAEEAAKAAGDPKAAGVNVTVDRGVLGVRLPPTFPGGSVQLGHQREFPPQAEPIFISLFAMIAIIVVGLPIMRALARRIDRGAPVAPPIPREVRDQLQQISQSVDVIAIEVERISEGQRFTTKMLTDRKSDVTMMAPASGKQG